MAQISTDFREYRRNRRPADWSPLWLDTAEALIRRASIDPADRQYLPPFEATVNAATGVLAGFSFDPLGAVGDTEVLALFSYGLSPSPNGVPLVYLRAGGTSSTKDALAIVSQPSSSNVQVFAQIYDNDSGVNAAGPYDLAVPTLHSFWLRVRLTGVSGSTLLSLRLWALGDEEPSTWDADEVTADAGGPPFVQSTGLVAVGCGVAEGDLRIHAFSIGTDGDPAPAFPDSPDRSLELAAPWYIAHALVYNRETEAEVDLWIPQAELPAPGWATEGGIATGPLDYPASEDFELGPVLDLGFSIDQALELDSFAALIDREVRSLSLIDRAVPGTLNSPPARPVRTAVQSYRWTGGEVTLYAVPAGATSLRERIAVASGVPAEEPTADGDLISIALDSRLKLAGEKVVEVEHYVGAQSGWRRLSGAQQVSVNNIAAYDITSYTLLTRFRSTTAPTSDLTHFWRRLSANSVWAQVRLSGTTGRVDWNIGNGTTTTQIAITPSGVRYDDDQPHELVCAIDGDRRFYLAIDGVVLVEGTPPFAPSTPNVVTWIARNLDGGYITDQRIVNGYLEPEQAFALQSSAPEADDLDLSVIGYWPFDDGAGNTVTDYSANANHGTASGTVSTHFAWVPTDLGMAELAGRSMPLAHGAIWNAPADATDSQRDRYRVTDRAIILPVSPAITLRARGVGVSETDAGGGVFTTLSTLDEPVTWAQLADVSYEDLLREVLPLRARLALGEDIGEESLAMLGRLLPDVAGYAAPSGVEVRVATLLEELIGRPGGHLRMAQDGLAVAGYLLPPVSPGPDGESAVLEYVGLPRAIHVPPPGTTAYASYTVCAWVKDFAGFGSPANAAEFNAGDLIPGSTYACHYDSSNPDEILYLLGSDGRVRSGLVFGDAVSSAPVYVSAPGSLPTGEWVFVAGVADATGGTRKLYRMLAGGAGVELLATAAYAGVAAGDRPGDGYTALGARPDGTASMVGSIAHVAFWGAALSESDLDDVATGSPLDVPTGLVSYLPGTEGAGDFLEDVTSGRSAIIQGQRWAPRLTVDLWALQDRAEMGSELIQRPAKSIKAYYRRNHRPATPADLAGSLTVAERRSFIEPHREASWLQGPDDGQEVEILTPFLRATSAQRIIELQRLRRTAGRYVRDLRLFRHGYTLDHGEEIRLDNLPAGGSWTGRVVALGRRAHEVLVGLWG